MKMREETWNITISEGDQEKANEHLMEVNQRRHRVFTPEEDEMITDLITKKGFRNWIEVAQEIPGKTPRQCRDRWENYLSPSISFKEWTLEDDMKLVELVNSIGTKWMTIAHHMPGRSDNMIKNRWYSNLKKRCTTLRSGLYKIKGISRKSAISKKVFEQPTEKPAQSAEETKNPEHKEKNPTQSLNLPEDFWDSAITMKIDEMLQDPFEDCFCSFKV